MGQLFHPRMQVRITGEVTGLYRLKIVDHRAHQCALIFITDDFSGFARTCVDACQGHFILGHTDGHCIAPTDTHGNCNLAGLADHIEFFGGFDHAHVCNYWRAVCQVVDTKLPVQVVRYNRRDIVFFNRNTGMLRIFAERLAQRVAPFFANTIGIKM